LAFSDREQLKLQDVSIWVTTPPHIFSWSIKVHAGAQVSDMKYTSTAGQFDHRHCVTSDKIIKKNFKR
jgi:hypothetical protein